MKKVGLLALFCLVLSLPALAQVDSQELKNKLNQANAQALLSYPSSFAKNTGVAILDIKASWVTRTINKKFNPDTDHPNKQYKYKEHSQHFKCPVVKIYDNWLLGHADCLDAYGYDTQKAKINGYEISNSQIIKNPLAENLSVALIYVPHFADTKLSQLLSTMPEANLLVLSKDATALDAACLNAELYINRSATLIQTNRKAVAVKTRVPFTQKGTILTLENENINGQLSDPLFALSAHNEEFLMGFNAGGNLKQRYSTEYQLFTQEDLAFIKQSILEYTPQIWNGLKYKIVNENFFKGK